MPQLTLAPSRVFDSSKYPIMVDDDKLSALTKVNCPETSCYPELAPECETNFAIVAEGPTITKSFYWQVQIHTIPFRLYKRHEIFAEQRPMSNDTTEFVSTMVATK